MTFKLWPPAPSETTYWRLSWLRADDSDPITIWYEVDKDGAVLRLVDLYRDGRAKVDSIDRYPDRASEFGFGTLIGDNFYALDWELNGATDDDPIVMMPASKREFDLIWSDCAS